MTDLISFETFRDVPIVVTGHTGFKGSWLLRVLQLAGAKVSGLALAPSSDSVFRDVHGEVPVDEIIDIRDAEAVDSFLTSRQPRIIFHLAAQALVQASYANPLETISTNVLGGSNLLNSARKIESLEGVVFITSDKAYENVEWEWGYRENDKLGGADPYSASKGAIELITSAFRRSFFHNESSPKIVVARAGNVIGGGDWSSNRIVPDVVRSVRDGGELRVRSPRATRPWQHVLEPLSGYLLLGSEMLKGNRELADAYNFGPQNSKPKTVLAVVRKLAQELGAPDKHIEEVDSEFHEAELLRLNIDRAQTDLGWSPRWDFESTLRETARWYKSVMQGEDPRDITDSQIMRYFSELAG